MQGPDRYGYSSNDKYDNRIIGGTEAQINKYPWIVSIKFDKDGDGSYFDDHCGGTLVASKYVITAAHCLWIKKTRTWMTPDQLQLIIGDHYILHKGESWMESAVKVSKIMGHEDYDGSNAYDNDIAILELATEQDLTRYTPACLAKSTDPDFAGVMAKVYGWGATKQGGFVHDRLMEVDLPVVSNADCSKNMSSITPGKLCAGGQAGKDACTVRRTKH